MANRQGEVDLRFPQVSAPQLELWLVLAHLTVYIQPLKMEMTQGSETSAIYNLTPGKYPKEYIQYPFHLLVSSSVECALYQLQSCFLITVMVHPRLHVIPLEGI